MGKFIKDSVLDDWIKNDLNALFIGEAGVGKTSVVLSAFERNGLKYRYYSASTMDPWVDMIGIPKEVTDPVTNRVYLDLIRPKDWADDDIEALFIDEYNRSAKKVKNAIMELIQFKSINGRKFNNLKIIWAAINPDVSDNPNAKYDVEPMDPAQKDRFHVHVTIPYECSEPYFTKKYGTTGKILVEWWDQLSKTAKFEVSPRRLDYLGNAIAKNLDIQHFLPKGINGNELYERIKQAEFDIQINEMILKSEDERAVWIASANIYSRLLSYLNKNPKHIPDFFHLLKKELIVSALEDSKFKFITHINKGSAEYKAKMVAIINNTNILTNEYKPLTSVQEMNLVDLCAMPIDTTQERVNMFNKLPIDLSILDNKMFHKLVSRFNDAITRTQAFVRLGGLHIHKKHNNVLAFLHIIATAIKNKVIFVGGISYQNPKIVMFSDGSIIANSIDITKNCETVYNTIKKSEMNEIQNGFAWEEKETDTLSRVANTKIEFEKLREGKIVTTFEPKHVNMDENFDVYSEIGLYK